MWLFRGSQDRFFDSEQRRQLNVLFEAILPGGEKSPGATDVGAAEYLDRLLAVDESTYYEISDWKALYPRALAALDQASVSLFKGRSLVDLKVDETTELLALLSRGELTGLPDGLDQKSLFATIRAHCIEGCFADPRWGGNREGWMWSWYGYLQPAREYRRDRAGGRT
jgi:gluconate 2-dehydrogenase gamma chain